MFLCDTNVIVRYLLEEVTPHGKEASALLDQTQSGKVKVLILEAVFVEVVFVLSKFYKVPRPELSQSLSNFLQYRGIVNERKNNWLLALEIYAATNFHIVDCLLVANTKQDESKLITSDEPLKKFASKKIDDM